MKKILYTFISIMMILAVFNACGNESDIEETTKPKVEVVTKEEVEETTEEKTTQEETSTEEESTTEKETTTEEKTTEEKTTISKKEEIISGVFIPDGQEQYFQTFDLDFYNLIEFKDNKAYVQMNLLEGVLNVTTDYTYDPSKNIITLSKGYDDYDVLWFDSGVKLYLSDTKNSFKIQGMKDAFKSDENGFYCSDFFFDGIIFEKYTEG